MTSIRQPRSVEAATELCERWATLDGQIAEIEERRQADIAAINADADRAATDLIAQRDKITEKLKPWWAKAGKELTKGKRKSTEIGGCMVGMRCGKAKLEVPGKSSDMVDELKGKRWAKPLLRVTTSLDAQAISKALLGKHGPKLKGLGFTIVPGDESFFVQRTEQEGTRT
ncbi:host-nuclease inhibitor Gam family protein [Qipengyuania sp.]|uniref:host-nuclease inhibitor Gam family protein n=1 Tax=Qipengyuania sp. TaxID=2004515 RepID=UPI003517BFA8